MTHLSQTEIEAIVMGTEPADERTRRHLRECAACAARLGREAVFEEALHDSLRVPRESAIPASPARGWRVAWSAAAAVAVVATGMWIAGSLSRDRAAPAPPPRLRAAVPAAAPEDVPGLLDPLELAPGYTLVQPSDYCRWLSAPPPEYGPAW
ncbi:MAG TPA: hypothetical protein VI504_06670 [Candidatus Eisenbacteria bacterium]|jgi:hypothetical protein